MTTAAKLTAARSRLAARRAKFWAYRGRGAAPMGLLDALAEYDSALLDIAAELATS